MSSKAISKLAVGSYYETRDGQDVVRITDMTTPSHPLYLKTHPYIDDDGYVYMKDGRTCPQRSLPFDLVKEVKQPRKKRNLKL